MISEDVRAFRWRGHRSGFISSPGVPLLPGCAKLIVSVFNNGVEKEKKESRKLGRVNVAAICRESRINPNHDVLLARSIDYSFPRGRKKSEARGPSSVRSRRSAKVDETIVPRGVEDQRVSTTAGVSRGIPGARAAR